MNSVDGIQLVHDVLDACLTDRNGRRAGRVDEVVLRIADGEPPCVSAILIGGPVRAARVGRWAATLRNAISALLHVRDSGVSRVPFAHVREVGETIKLDVEVASLPSTNLERWLADHIIGRIPGSQGEKK